ncbi:hypothetical protein D1872_261430 [compost metagenome]
MLALEEVQIRRAPAAVQAPSAPDPIQQERPGLDPSGRPVQFQDFFARAVHEDPIDSPDRIIRTPRLPPDRRQEFRVVERFFHQLARHFRKRG